MNILKKNFKNKNIEFIVIFICTFSFFFLWDLSNFFLKHEIKTFFQFKYIFSLLLFISIKYFDYKKIKKFYFFFLFFFIIQIYTFFYLNIYNLNNIFSFIFLIIILFNVIHLKIKIFYSLLYSYYLVIILLVAHQIANFSYSIIPDFLSCSFFFNKKKFIFYENSHFAMLFVSVFYYFSYQFFFKKNFLDFIFFFFSFILIIINFSLSFLIGYIFSCIILLVLNYFNFLKLGKNFLIFLSTILILLMIIFSFNRQCNVRVLDISESILISVGKTFAKNQNMSESEIKKNENMPNRYNYNLSALVVISHLENMYETFKDYPFGVGINNYHISYKKRVNSDINKKIASVNNGQLLNQNDGRAVIIKGVVELGIFILIFFISFFYFIKSKKIPNVVKIVIIPLVITQLFSGAGYFNGGFLVSLFIMISYSSYNRENILIKF